MVAERGGRGKNPLIQGAAGKVRDLAALERDVLEYEEARRRNMPMSFDGYASIVELLDDPFTTPEQLSNLRGVFDLLKAEMAVRGQSSAKLLGGVAFALFMAAADAFFRVSLIQSMFDSTRESDEILKVRIGEIEAVLDAIDPGTNAADAGVRAAGMEEYQLADRVARLSADLQRIANAYLQSSELRAFMEHEYGINDEHLPDFMGRRLGFHRAGTTSYILTVRAKDDPQQRVLKILKYKYLTNRTINAETEKYLDMMENLAHGQNKHVIKVVASSPRWILMDFGSGRTLGEFIREEVRRSADGRLIAPDDLRLVADLAIRLLRALKTVWLNDSRRAPQLHLDLAPANVLIETEIEQGQDRRSLRAAEMRFIDFGYNHTLRDGVSAADSLQNLLRFVAPELRRSIEAADVRTDLYSFGQILFDMLCTSAGDGSDDEMVRLDILWRAYPNLATVVADLIEREQRYRLVGGVSPDWRRVDSVRAQIDRLEKRVGAAADADETMMKTLSLLEWEKEDATARFASKASPAGHGRVAGLLQPRSRWRHIPVLASGLKVSVQFPFLLWHFVPAIAKLLRGAAKESGAYLASWSVVCGFLFSLCYVAAAIGIIKDVPVLAGWLKIGVFDWALKFLEPVGLDWLVKPEQIADALPGRLMALSVTAINQLYFLVVFVYIDLRFLRNGGMIEDRIAEFVIRAHPFLIAAGTLAAVGRPNWWPWLSAYGCVVTAWCNIVATGVVRRARKEAWPVFSSVRSTHLDESLLTTQGWATGMLLFGLVFLVYGALRDYIDVSLQPHDLVFAVGFALVNVLLVVRIVMLRQGHEVRTLFLRLLDARKRLQRAAT